MASSRTIAFFCAFIVALAGAFPAAYVLTGPASAQEPQPRQSSGGLLRHLFRRAEPAPQVQQVPRAQQRQQRAQRPQQRSQQRARAAAPARPEPAAVAKSEDARTILVVGDFLAGGLAEGLVAAYAENADVRVVGRANGSSGLVRDDHYDWPARIGGVLDEVEPDIVVLMLGSNDRQQMRVGGSREQPMSEPWMKEYEGRATRLAQIITDRKLPLVWVGTLPFQSGAMSSGMVALNDVYRRVSGNVGGEFVDVWDGFVDENGVFVLNGPDMNGQPTQLRASDGINVTQSGRRKIAFYVEKPLNRILGGAQPSPGVARAGPMEVFGPGMEGMPTVEIDRTMPISLSGPDPEPEGALLGGHVTIRNGESRTMGERLMRDGLAPAPHPGRADDFMSARRPAPTAAAPEPAAGEILPEAEADSETTSAIVE